MRLLYCFVFLLIPEVGIAQQSIQQQLNSCQLLLGKAVIESNQYQMINQQLNYSYDEQGKALKEAIIQLLINHLILITFYNCFSKQ